MGERARRPRLAIASRGRAVRVVGLLGTSFGGVAEPLRDAQFRWLWLSTFAWNFARWMELTVTSWVALELTGSPWLVAMIGVSRQAFLPLLGPVIGALSDRFDRLRMMRTAQWGNVLFVGAVAAALLSGHGAYWQLVLCSLWLGASWGIDWPSRRALIADMVGPERVLQAIVLDNWTQNLSRIAGPLLGGVLLEHWRGPGAYGALAGSFLVASLTLSGVRPIARAVAITRNSVRRELAAGLAYVRRDAAMWAVLLITLVMNLLLFPYQTLLSVFAEDVLRVGPVGLGALGAANGVGAVLALFLLPPLRTPRWQFRAFAGGSCLGCVALFLFTRSTWFTASLGLLLLTGLGTSAFGTMQSTIVLSRAAPAMRGRAMGLLALAIGSAPLGAFEMGLVVERFGAPAAVGVNAAVCGAIVAWLWWHAATAARRQRRYTEAAEAEAEAASA
jgi:MFS family permease